MSSSDSHIDSTPDFIKEEPKAVVENPLKYKVFTSQEVETFLNQAPDEIYLVMKVGLILAIAFEMDKPLSADDFAAIESQLKDCVEQDRRYWKVNDVKCDAIHSAKTYEEFADRVAAAHLNPLHNADYKKKCPRKWNQYATVDKKSDE